MLWALVLDTQKMWVKSESCKGLVNSLHRDKIWDRNARTVLSDRNIMWVTNVTLNFSVGPQKSEMKGEINF